MSDDFLNATVKTLMDFNRDELTVTSESPVDNLFKTTTTITFLGISTKSWVTVMTVYLAVVFVFIIVMTLCCLCCNCFEDPRGSHASTLQQQSRVPPSIVVIPHNSVPSNNSSAAPLSARMPSPDTIIKETETVTHLPDGSVCTERTTIKSHSSERRRLNKSKNELASATDRLSQRRTSQRSHKRNSRNRRACSTSTQSNRSNHHVSFLNKHQVNTLMPSKSNTSTTTDPVYL